MSPDPLKYLARFGAPSCTDLHGDFFTKFTDFGARQSFPIKFSHGMCPVLGHRTFGRAHVVPDGAGLRIGWSLDLFDPYAKALYELHQAGVLTWSAAADHVERLPADGAFWIKRFWITEASLTPTPAEPWRDPNPRVIPYTPEQIKANVSRPLSAPARPGVDGWIEHQTTLRDLYNRKLDTLYAYPKK